jgi:hypothetical protein
MPAATKRWLADYARDGGTVLAVRRKPEGEWASLELVSEDDLSARLARGAPADLTLTPPTPEVGFVHRRLPDAGVYFLANSGNLARTVRARFRTATPHAERWDPLTGAVERLSTPDGEIAIQFEPYGSRVVVFRKEAGSALAARTRAVNASEDLRSGWSVRFGGAGTGVPIDLPHSWSADPARRFFSGTASYRVMVRPPAAFRSAEGRVYLDFGEAKPIEREPLPGGTLRGNSFAALVAPPIREAATVFVNGRRAGSLWAPPYRVDVTDLLRDGANDIRVDVYNTAVNQLAGGGRLPDMKPVVERYGLRTRLQDLDGLQPLPSGILAPPRLVLER